MELYSIYIIIISFFIITINKVKILWGLGIGDWGLGIGDWAQSPIPNPQSPIPNPQDLIEITIFVLIYKQVIIE